jgi:hypothetical protein
VGGDIGVGGFPERHRLDLGDRLGGLLSTPMLDRVLAAQQLLTAFPGRCTGLGKADGVERPEPKLPVLAGRPVAVPEKPVSVQEAAGSGGHAQIQGATVGVHADRGGSDLSVRQAIEDGSRHDGLPAASTSGLRFRAEGDEGRRWGYGDEIYVWQRFRQVEWASVRDSSSCMPRVASSRRSLQISAT